MRSKFIRILFVCVFIFNIQSVFAETIETIECEYTDAYKEWLKMSEEERKKMAFQPIMCKTDDKFYNLVGNESVKASYTSQKFDLRDYNAVSKMKDQGDIGACWTFATLESIESNRALNGKAYTDYSEAHMELATQNSLFESILPYTRTFSTGGNSFISSAYLMNRVGPVAESSVPYNLLTNYVSGKGAKPTLNDITNKKVEVAVNDIAIHAANQGVCNNDSITSIKKYLVSNGAMFASVYFEIATSDFSLNGSTLKDKFINGKYYYYDGSSYLNYEDKVVAANRTINHAITIVGWDDSISKDNFSTKPSRDGAWLIKNSYGEKMALSDSQYVDMGDNGYYYVSYDDVNICSLVAGFYNIEDEVEDNIYYHDKLSSLPLLNLQEDSTYYLASIFSRNKETGEFLDKISFYSYSLNQKYDILYGTDFESLSVIHSGVIDKTGVTTVKVDPIYLTNDEFVLAIRITGKKGDYISGYTKISGTFYSMDVPEGVSYISIDGKNWEDFASGDLNFLAPIRGYASNADYTFTLKDTTIVDDCIDVDVNVSDITDYDNITYNIYSVEDINFTNSLNEQFEITNDIVNNGLINVTLNDSSLVGEYVLVAKYKEAIIKINFEVIDDNGELLFKESAKVENDENKAPDLVVNDNPNNDTNLEPEEENISENPKTGISQMTIIGMIFIFMIGILIFYSNYYLKKITNNRV